ncbi:MAG: GGGtGRT protein, partial [Candidatus Treponema excrementipullorum]|nr:GGGtGRT protein [Candidatus Treponema excrementipullorum]
MAEKITFESYERRIDKVNKALNENGIASLEEAKEICDKAGIDPYKTVEETQPIA